MITGGRRDYEVLDAVPASLIGYAVTKRKVKQSPFSESQRRTL
jgi:hypothetical protein